MSKKIVFSFMVAFVVLWLCGLASASSPLVLNTDDGEPRSTPEGSGFQDRIIRESFRRIGIEIRIVHLPSERALANANEGIDDGNFVRIAGIEKNYPNLVMVPEKICDFEFAAFTRNPAIAVTNWQSLKPYNVGIITGWKILETNVVGTRSLTKVVSPDALFELLHQNRADLIVFDRPQGYALLRRKGYTGIRPLEPLLAQRDMFLYLNRRHQALVPKVAEALRAMKRDGTHQRIIDSALAAYRQP